MKTDNLLFKILKKSGNEFIEKEKLINIHKKSFLIE